MERINVMVSDRAKQALTIYQIKNKYKNLDKALDAILVAFGETQESSEVIV